jgi:hypothetical protein
MVYELAMIAAEKVRHVYTKIAETIYPEYAAAEGKVLPVDSSPAPSDETWRYFMVDTVGTAAWIDQDGDVAPSNSMTMRQYDGPIAEFGHQWDVTIFDLEKASAGNLNLRTMKGKSSKRAHQAFKNWMWLFGDPSKSGPGLCNHPNIQVLLSAQNAGLTSRLWANKTDDEIFADVKRLIDTVPQTTIRASYVAKVLISLELQQECLGRFVSATASGTVTLWDKILAAYRGDDTGQGQVTFMILNECGAGLRSDPTDPGGADTSGLDGDFLLAMPADDVEEHAFVSARPFSQMAPQEEKFKINTLTHERIGFVKLQRPTWFVRMDFGTV